MLGRKVEIVHDSLEEQQVVLEMQERCIVCRRKMPQHVKPVCDRCADHACIECGELDEDKLRFDESRGERGVMQCFKCVPETARERLKREYKLEPSQPWDPAFKLMFDELDKHRGKDGWRRE